MEQMIIGGSQQLANNPPVQNLQPVQPLPIVALTSAINILGWGAEERELIAGAIGKLNFNDNDLRDWTAKCQGELVTIQQIFDDQLDLTRQLQQETGRREQLNQRNRDLEVVRDQLMEQRTQELAGFAKANTEIQESIVKANENVAKHNWGQFAIGISKRAKQVSIATPPLVTAYHYMDNCGNSSIGYCALQGAANPWLLVPIGGSYVAYNTAEKVLKATAAYQKALKEIASLEAQQRAETERHQQALAALNETDQKNATDTRTCTEDLRTVEGEIQEINALQKQNSQALTDIQTQKHLENMQLQIQQLRELQAMQGNEQIAYNMTKFTVMTLGNGLVGAFQSIITQQERIANNNHTRLTIKEAVAE
ncbi:MAG: hypothetical protein Q8K75_07890 [Chlamydiales bacterium]|nr:hypothetical protein [Chlamydiales bacterium]